MGIGAIETARKLEHAADALAGAEDKLAQIERRCNTNAPINNS